MPRVAPPARDVPTTRWLGAEHADPAQSLDARAELVHEVGAGELRVPGQRVTQRRSPLLLREFEAARQDMAYDRQCA